jgi:putative tryptophan/tyrosine transport system substrate-binding protein
MVLMLGLSPYQSTRLSRYNAVALSLGADMRRREFIRLLGGAVAWPFVARAQQPERIRRIGVLMPFAENDPQTQTWLTAFQQGLQELGWTAGRNVRFEYRFAGPDPASMRTHAVELVTLAPDVILAASPPVLAALQHETRTIPIVFVNVADPVGADLVQSLARPGGNMTGFTDFEFAIVGKWLELLKEIAPSITRVAVIMAPEHVTNAALLRSIEAVAPSFGVHLTPARVRDAGEIERGINVFARESNGGLIVLPNPVTVGVPSKEIISLAARHRLPAVYPFRFLVTNGGLISYGPDIIDQYRRTASYVDRILKGEKPADLPVQAPTKYELAINLKTAKSLGLDVPVHLQQIADEVIE